MPIKLLDMAVRYALGHFGTAGRSGDSATGASFVGALALAGLVVSIAVLVFVISVVNGFEREMRERLLNVLPHITATSPQGTSLADLAALPTSDASSGLTALAPVTQSSGLLSANGEVRSAQITGVDESYAGVSAVADFAVDGAFTDIQRTAFGIALGGRLADQLQVEVGDNLRRVAAGSTTQYCWGAAASKALYRGEHISQSISAGRQRHVYQSFRCAATVALAWPGPRRAGPVVRPV